jgi:hypothetical protein
VRACGRAIACKGADTIFTGQRERERERERDIKREREREGERERERERDIKRERERGGERERGRERCRIWLLNLKGMTGALAPFSYLVVKYLFFSVLVLDSNP